MSMGHGGGSDIGRGGMDYLNAMVKARTRLGPSPPSDPIPPGRPRRRLVKVLVASVIVAVVVVVVILAL
jgi:hypothetical protein